MLILSYKGTDFHGFQKQPDARTVQGALEEALSTLAGETVVTCGAGRTDAGVHAAGQVAAFDAVEEIDTGRWRKSLNALTPPDISVLDVREVSASFDPRRDAVMREYRYFLLNRLSPSPALADICLHFPGELDLELASMACSSLVGTHDFRAFTLASETRATVREIAACRIGEVGVTGGLLHIVVRAPSFIYRMVRVLAAAVLDVGTGKLGLSDLSASLTSGEGPCADPLPPEGLFLWKVEYPQGRLSA